MINNAKVGASLAKQSPWGVLFTGIIFGVLALMDTLNISNILYAMLSGHLTGAALLAYWHGKGGMYFIAALLMPLVLIMVAELPYFMSLAWVINGFFFGLAFSLFIYHIYLSQFAK
jgi:hypothetical protein